MGKRARKFIAINSHAYTFFSAAYLCMQQQIILVLALSRLIETIAKSIKLLLVQKKKKKKNGKLRPVINLSC